MKAWTFVKTVAARILTEPRAVITIIVVGVSFGVFHERFDEEFFEHHRESVLVVAACADPSGGQCSPAILVNGPILPPMFDGRSGHSIAEEVESALAEQREQGHDIHLICFNSPGGSVIAGKKLANLIEAKGLDTCVTQVVKYKGNYSYIPAACDSTCGMAFSAGKRRVAYQSDIAFLFHRADSGTDETVPTFYRTHHLPKLADLVENTPNENAEPLDVTTLEGLGLVNDVRPNTLRDVPADSALADCRRRQVATCTPAKSGRQTAKNEDKTAQAQVGDSDFWWVSDSWLK